MPRWSEFERRASLYAALDRELLAWTRFFAAAALTNAVLASLYRCLPSGWVTAGSYALLSDLGAMLESVNRDRARHLKHESVGGWALDRELVRTEQAIVQSRLDTARGAANRRDVRAQLNTWLNGTSVFSGWARFSEHASRYQTVLSQVRRRRGTDLDFAIERDRVQIGCALIEHVRSNALRSEGLSVRGLETALRPSRRGWP